MRPSHSARNTARPCASETHPIAGQHQAITAASPRGGEPTPHRRSGPDQKTRNILALPRFRQHAPGRRKASSPATRCPNDSRPLFRPYCIFFTALFMCGCCSGNRDVMHSHDEGNTIKLYNAAISAIKSEGLSPDSYVVSSISDSHPEGEVVFHFLDPYADVRGWPAHFSVAVFRDGRTQLMKGR